MRWSIHEVARMSGVTARALRHYDAIGLLPPASTGANGYRFYDRDQLLRLQEILLLRALGLDLTTIAGILDGAGDRIAVLRDHHRWLLAERSRLDRLARTVAETIAHLESGEDMAAEEMFDGFRFNRETLDELEAIAAERSGGSVSPYFEEVRERTASWTAEDFQAAERAGADVEVRLLALLNEGKPADARKCSTCWRTTTRRSTRCGRRPRRRTRNSVRPSRTPRSCARTSTRGTPGWPATCATRWWRTRGPGCPDLPGRRCRAATGCAGNAWIVRSDDLCYSGYFWREIDVDEFYGFAPIHVELF